MACGGNQGPAGPTGPEGPAGAGGPVGPAGKDGNANVVLYEYGSRKFIGAVDYRIPNISPSVMDSSMVLAYYNPSYAVPTMWYPVPGFSDAGMYDVRSYLNWTPPDYTLSVRLQSPSGGAYTSEVTFTKFRIFVVRASSVVSMSKARPGIELTDYHAVSRYFGIQD
jgi:hypothetical protein